MSKKKLKGGTNTLSLYQKKYNDKIENQMEKDKIKNKQNVPLQEENVSENVNIEHRSFTICSKCKVKKMCSRDRFLKLLQKYGTIEKMDKEYVCISCRKIK